MNTQLENLQRQLRISDQIDIIMKQTLELMDMVNRNQLKVNILKAEIDKLKTQQDNATDQLDDDGDKYRDSDIMVNQ